jgi:hypothetical protein
MMRRNIWSIGLIVSAFSALLWTTAAAQQQCCAFRVRHNFKVCLNGCQFAQVQWDWFTQASAWFPPVTNTNAGSAIYPIPSNDTQCTTAATQQQCAIAAACARFQVNWIPGTNCVQGMHEAFGRACANCRQSGAQAIAKSHIVIQCGTPNAAGLIQWQPALDDIVGGECGVQNHDPVVLKLRNPATGETRDEVLFDLRASGFSWEYQDFDGDDWGDTAHVRPGPSYGGHVTLMKARTAGGGSESRLHLRYENGIVVESENTGEFARLQWPHVGDPVPPEIEVPVTFNLPVEVPSGWVLEQIVMGGDGESGNTPPTPGDVNGDGCVDDADLLAVLFAFGQTGSGLPEDVNGDGVVDDADLLIVLFAFGQGC